MLYSLPWWSSPRWQLAGSGSKGLLPLQFGCTYQPFCNQVRSVRHLHCSVEDFPLSFCVSKECIPKLDCLIPEHEVNRVELANHLEVLGAQLVSHRWVLYIGSIITLPL